MKLFNGFSVTSKSPSSRTISACTGALPTGFPPFTVAATSTFGFNISARLSFTSLTKVVGHYPPFFTK